MARMHPKRLQGPLASSAEAMLFQQLSATLADEFHVIHSVNWVEQLPGQTYEGEADFVILHSKHGLLALEVKGGQVSRDGDTGRWASVDRDRVGHEIDNPFDQAARSMRAITRRLTRTPSTQGYDYHAKRAVCLPHVLVPAEGLGPEAPRQLIIDSSDLANLQAALLRAWNPGSATGPGTGGVAAAVSLLAPTTEIARTGLVGQMGAEAIELAQLTEEQRHAFEIVAAFPRVAVRGVAGSGKTLLALEQTRRLAMQGYEVLYTCFNQGLADWAQHWLETNLDAESAGRVYADNYHDLAEDFARAADLKLPKQSELANQETANCYFSEELPQLLLKALTVVPHRFDAIVVDEGQDFAALWWETLAALFRDPEEGLLTIFYDDQQQIFDGRGANYPIPLPHAQLTRDCRTTAAIHKAASRYGLKERVGTCDGPPGRAIEVVSVVPGHEIEVLRKVVHELVHEQKVDLADIVVLTPRSHRTSLFKDGEQIGNATLRWKGTGKGELRIDSISAYKGLESPVVILAELDRIYVEQQDALIHVGLSRAQHHVIVLGELPKPSKRNRL